MLGAVLSSRVGDADRRGPGRDPGAAARQRLRRRRPGRLRPGARRRCRTLIRVSYGDATGQIFLVSAVIAVVAVVAVVLIREIALRTQSGEERLRAEAVTVD